MSSNALLSLDEQRGDPNPHRRNAFGRRIWGAFDFAGAHEHFCAELASRYAKLSDEDKESLKHYGVSYNYGGKQDHGMLSGYATEVVPYCGDR